MISLIKDSLLYSSSKIISGIVNLLVIVIFTRLLNQNEYGQYLIFVSYTFFIGSIFYWAHRLSTYRYLNFHEIASYKEAAKDAILPSITIEEVKVN